MQIPTSFIKTVGLIGLILYGTMSFGQDFFLTQIHRSSVFINPALSGVDSGTHLKLSNRNAITQFADLREHFFGFAFYSRRNDTSANALGVKGIFESKSFFNSWASGTGADLFFSKRLYEKDKMRLVVSGEVGFRYTLFDHTGNTSGAPEASEFKSYSTVGVGAILRIKNYILGISGFNLNQPRVKLLTGEFAFDPFFIGHLSAEYTLTNGYKLNPSIIYRQLGRNGDPVIDFLSFIEIDPVFELGAGFRKPFRANQNSYFLGEISTLVADKYRLGISYEFPISSATITSGVTNYVEGSFGMIIGNQ